MIIVMIIYDIAESGGKERRSRRSKGKMKFSPPGCVLGKVKGGMTHRNDGKCFVRDAKFSGANGDRENDLCSADHNDDWQ